MEAVHAKVLAIGKGDMNRESVWNALHDVPGYADDVGIQAMDIGRGKEEGTALLAITALRGVKDGAQEVVRGPDYREVRQTVTVPAPLRDEFLRVVAHGYISQAEEHYRPVVRGTRKHIP